MNWDLSDAEFTELDGLLAEVVDGLIPNTEALDGLYAAIIAGRWEVSATEILVTVITGSPPPGQLLFGDDSATAARFSELIWRHFDDVRDSIVTDRPYFPALVEYENGRISGEEWAKGFLVGMDFNKDHWVRLVDDEETGGLFIPILALAYASDPDPEFRPYPEPMDDERRLQLIAASAAAVASIYELRTVEDQHADWRRPRPIRRTKIGRNDPCPCGSGKKHKKCCGAPTAN